MTETSKLLINNTLNVKGAILDAKDMLIIKNHYRRATVQEFVFENTKDVISAEDALSIADRAIEIMDDTSYCEEDAIKIARDELGLDIAFKFAGSEELISS